MRHGFHKKEFDDATRVKLQIFRRYAREWISVLLTRSDRQFSQLNIYDFFAGPGRDVAGNPGSPLIILEELKAFCRSRESLKADIPVRMVFNDKNEEHIATLQQEVTQARCPESCCRFEFSALPFMDALPYYLPEMKESGHANLVLMDQFGVKEVTPEIVNTLLSCGSTDIMFFVSSSFIKRFIETPEIQTKFNLDPGEIKNVEYRAIHRYICDHYRSALGVRGALVAPFSIKKGANIYGVIFATRIRLGMEKFLRICWTLDPSTGEANYNIDDDPAWSGERFLLPEMNTITKVDLFERSLAGYIRQETPNNIELHGFCLEQGFCASKANESLRKLQKTCNMLVTDVASGTAARKSSFYLTERTERVRIGLKKNAPKQN
jgi:three-Cys-motif partner protein